MSDALAGLAASRAWINGADSPELAELYAELGELLLEPLWEVFREVQSTEPIAGAAGVPHLWSWKEMRRVAIRAAELMPMGRGGERRGLLLVNPAFPSAARATHTLCAGVQIILPGEAASCHRHTASALRLILEGSGAHTAVDGEPVPMRPGDLLITPNMAWHDHTHEGTEPMLWMDVLDIPLVNMLNASFFEVSDELHQPLTRPAGWSHDLYGSAAIAPAHIPPPARNPLLVYPWEQTEAALERLARIGPDSYDGIALRYVNPATGGPVVATLDAWMQQLPAGFRTRAHRHTASVVYHAFHGRGRSIIAGESFEWEQGDYFVVPPWCWHEHENGSGDKPALLFSVNDGPVLRAFGLDREEPHPEGHQRD